MKMNREAIEAIIFDLDGTLMETDDHLVGRLTGFFSWFRPRNPEKLARWVVMKAETPVNGLITLMDRLGIDQAVMKLAGRRKKESASQKPLLPEMEGVGAMLRLLKGKYRLGLVTTNCREVANRFLAAYGIADCFDVVVSRSSVKRLKPHPEPLLFAAQQMGVRPENCLMVGDTTPDMESAVAAGIHPVGVLCGFGTRDELLRAGARAVLDHTSDVLEYLESN